MKVGAVLSEAWKLYRRFFGRFVLTAAVIYVFLDLLSAIGAAADSGEASFVWFLVSFVVGLVGFFWVQGALVEAVRDVRDGRIDLPVSDLYSRARPRLPALISAGVLAVVGITLGLILLIIPGLYLLARWLFIVPAIVLEGRSAGESFGRSSEIGAGHRWSILGLALVTLIGAG